LRGYVRAVAGLDTRAVARPAAFPAGGLRPVDARRVYGMEGLARRGRLGEGETVAVLSLDSFRDEDVAEYDRIVGIDARPVERVPVDGGTRLGSGSEEVNLDLDVIRGLVPRARLLNYEARNEAGAFAAVMERIVEDGRADVVSISWGRCELHVAPGDRAADEAAFAAAAAAGIAVFVASGDYGAYECERFDSADQRLSVSWPAASRHVLAVGGTSLRLGADRRRSEEYGWESPLSNHGAGGGVAAAEPAPPWQADAELPGLRNEHSTGRRQVPDVAAAADFRSGWLMVVDGERRQVGGTSAAAPFWAAVAVVLRESLREAGRRPPRSLARALYAVAARPGSDAFHDVVAGGNRFHDAGPGWDFVTGIGTPDVGRLVTEMTKLSGA
jgi:kumamolisin